MSLYLELIRDVHAHIERFLDPLSLVLSQIARGRREEGARRHGWNAHTDKQRAEAVAAPWATLAQRHWLHEHRFHVDASLVCLAAAASGRVDLLAYYYSAGMLDTLLMIPAESSYGTNARRRGLVSVACRAGQYHAAVWLADTLGCPLESSDCFASGHLDLIGLWFEERAHLPGGWHAKPMDESPVFVLLQYTRRDDAESIVRLEYLAQRFPRDFYASPLVRDGVLSASSYARSTILLAWCVAHFPSIAVSVEMIQHSVYTYESTQAGAYDQLCRYWSALWPWTSLQVIQTFRDDMALHFPEIEARAALVAFLHERIEEMTGTL